MKPLSTVTYLKSNVNKVMPAFVCMVLGVFLTYFLSLIIYSGICGMGQSFLNILERVTKVSTNTKAPISDKVLSKIKDCSNVEYVIPIIDEIGGFEYKSPFGQITAESFNIFEDDIPKVLEIFDLKLVEGKLPSHDSNELLIPLKIAKQNKIKIGDYIGKNPDFNIILNKKYKVCGIMDGPINTMLTTNAAKIKKEDAVKYKLIFSLKDKNNKAINDELRVMKGKKVNIIDYKFAYSEMNEVTSVMNSFRFILSFIVIIVLCICLGNLNYILFLNRKNEFAILAAIGYRKNDLYKKLLKETIALNLLGFIFGIIITIIIIRLLNITVYEPKGEYVYSFQLKSLFIAFLIPLSVSITNMILPLRQLKNMNHDYINI